MLEGVSVALVALLIFVMSRVPVAVRTDMEGAQKREDFKKDEYDENERIK